MSKIRQALQLLADSGLSRRQVAAALGISKTTVSEIALYARDAGIDWAMASTLSDDELQARLYPPPRPRSSARSEPDYAALHQELKRPGVTLQLLWEEYPALGCVGRNTAPVALESAFGCRLRSAGELSGVDGPAKMRLPLVPSTGYSLPSGRFHRSRNHSDAGDPAALVAGSPELSRLGGLRPLAGPGDGLAPEAAPGPATPGA